MDILEHVSSGSVQTKFSEFLYRTVRKQKELIICGNASLFSGLSGLDAIISSTVSSSSSSSQTEYLV